MMDKKSVQGEEERMCGAAGNCGAQLSLTLTLSRSFTLTRSCGAASPATQR